MSDENSTPKDESPFDRAMREREERKAKLRAEREARRQADLLKLDELERQHGDDHVRGVWTDAGLVALRKPRAVEVAMCEQAIAQDGKPAAKAERQVEALKRLGRQCLLYPDKAAYEAMVEAYPGIALSVGSEAMKLAGEVREEEAGKS